MKRFGLRAKFVLFLLGLLVLILGLITLILIHINTRTLRDKLIRESTAFAALATQPIGDTFVLYRDSGRVRILQQVEKFTDLNPDITNVVVVDLEGRPVFSQRDWPALEVSAEAAASFEPTFTLNSNGELVQVVQPYLENFGLHRYAVAYGISNAGINANINQVVRLILLFTILTLAVCAVLGYQLVNQAFLRPIGAVSRAALAISQGQLSQQIKIDRRDEIGDLASSVNTMAESLKADIQKLKDVDAMKSEFMMITSHNLRTPLTVINGYLETLKQAKLPPELSKTIDTVAASSKRLGVFAEDILTISGLEAGQVETITRQPTDLAELFESVVPDVTVLAQDKGIKLTTVSDPGLVANLSPAHFRNALWNLFDNALKFTMPGGRIKLVARARHKSITIAISDTGIGIAPAELPKLFTKFHRGTSTLKYQYEGTGIGLYLTKLIVEQHGGTIAIDSHEGTGTTVTITLPQETNASLAR